MLMKYLLAAIAVMQLLTACHKKESMNREKRIDIPRWRPEAVNPPMKLKDSFTFCSMKFSIPRECDEEQETNCCDVDIDGYMHNFSCYNGTSLFWEYVNIEWAEDIFISLPPQIKKHAKSYKKEPITCYILGKKLPGLKETFEPRSGGELVYSILTYGTVNDQSFYCRLISQTDIKNNEDIPPGIRQVFRVKP